MRINELRIGNYVLFGSTNCKVIEIQEDCFYAENSSQEILKNTWAKLKPIPLTEDWLLNFGFVKSDNQYNRFEKGAIGVVLLENNHCVDIYDSYNEFHTSLVLINYIHQLQNLYFSLTNEELTLKQ